RSYSSTGGSGISYTISNYNIFEISGFLSNMKFQIGEVDSLKTLTDKRVLIETASYLKPFADKTKQQLMVYVVSDTDTNKDGRLDGNDIKSLYISTLDVTTSNHFTSARSMVKDLRRLRLIWKNSSI